MSKKNSYEERMRTFNDYRAFAESYALEVAPNGYSFDDAKAVALRVLWERTETANDNTLNLGFTKLDIKNEIEAERRGMPSRWRLKTVRDNGYGFDNIEDHPRIENTDPADDWFELEPDLKDEKFKTIYRMRLEGFEFGEIGERYGITAQAAESYFRKHAGRHISKIYE